MKKLLCSLLTLFSLTAFCQGNGVHFENGLSWQQVLEKAKKENKFIFVDCYATWCKPCRQMDQNVYPDSALGSYMNSKFISIRVQMDTASSDNEEVKSWYQTAHDLEAKYKINAYPSFLFFSSDGVAVDKAIGYFAPMSFQIIATDALNPEKQYYTLFNQYGDSHIKHYNTMPFLIQKANRLGDHSFAKLLRRDYTENYLSFLKESDLFTEANLDFFSYSIESSKEIGFTIFYNNVEKIDSIEHIKGFAHRTIDRVIINEEINPVFAMCIKENKEPKWDKVISAITQKYNGDYAQRTVMNAKISWYKYTKKDYAAYAKALISMVKKYGPQGIGQYDFDLNNNAWELFQYSSDAKDLTTALAWSDEAISTCFPSSKANWTDTKANILYKLGRKDEAILLEQTVVQMAPNDKGFQAVLEKMKKGEPTWPKL